jgi:hypothetical protein
MIVRIENLRGFTALLLRFKPGNIGEAHVRNRYRRDARSYYLRQSRRGRPCTTGTAKSWGAFTISWSTSAPARFLTPCCRLAASSGWGRVTIRLPWNQLTYEPAQGGYVVDLTRQQLEGAPTYPASQDPLWDDPAYSRGIDDYYRPYSRRI